MNATEFKQSLQQHKPHTELTAPLAALWWDAKGDWSRAHSLVDELETPEAMAVHAYLHRKEGEEWNADYWYRRAGKPVASGPLDAEWEAIVQALLVRAI